MLGQVAKELPHAAVLTFAVQPGGEGTQLVATVQSAEGGRISILLGPDRRDPRRPTGIVMVED